MCISYFLLPRIDNVYNLEYDLGKNMEYLYMLVMSHHGTAAKPSRRLGLSHFLWLGRGDQRGLIVKYLSVRKRLQVVA